MDTAALTAMAHERMPLTAHFGFEVEGDPQEMVVRGRWSPEHCTSAGLLHGGYLMALADTAGGMCAFFHLPEGAGTATIESKTNFIRAVRGGEVRATARPVHVGRTTILVQTDITDAEGRLVTRTLQTQAVLPAAAPGA